MKRTSSYSNLLFPHLQQNFHNYWMNQKNSLTIYGNMQVKTDNMENMGAFDITTFVLKNSQVNFQDSLVTSHYLSQFEIKCMDLTVESLQDIDIKTRQVLVVFRYYFKITIEFIKRIVKMWLKSLIQSVPG